MKTKNTLNELNEILFDNIRKLNESKIDVKQATAIVNMSNSIIDNAKTQLQAFKLTENPLVIGSIVNNEIGAPPVTNRLPKTPSPLFVSKDGYTVKNSFAVELGYENVAEAISVMGKNSFLEKFKESSIEAPEPKTTKTQ